MTDRKQIPAISRAVRKAIERELAGAALREDQKLALYKGYLSHASVTRCAAEARMDPRTVALWYHRLALRTALASHMDVLVRNDTEK